MAMTIGGKTPQSIEIGGKAVQSLAIGGEVVWSAAPSEPDYFWIESTYARSANSIYITKMGSPTTGTDLEYSTDKTNWASVTYTNNEFDVSLTNGQKVYLRSTTGFSQSTTARYTVSSSESIEVGGDIMTLIDYTDTSADTITSYAFYSMFEDSTTLEAINQLSFSRVRTVEQYGMSGMFSGCTLIAEGPDLSMITSVSHTAGMSSLYRGCSLLSTVTAPSLNPWVLPDETYSMATYGWMASVADTGTMYVKTGYPVTSNHSSGRPSGWTRVDI